MGELYKSAKQSALEFYSQYSAEQLNDDQRQVLIEEYIQDFINESRPEAYRSLSENASSFSYCSGQPIFGTAKVHYPPGYTLHCQPLLTHSSKHQEQTSPQHHHLSDVTALTSLEACVHSNTDFFTQTFPPLYLVHTLSLVNKLLFGLVSPFISTHCHFKPRRYNYYKPQRIIKIGNEDISCLSASYPIQFLSFNDFFNLPLENILPPTLTHLILGNRFTQPLPITLPPKLTHLVLGRSFSQKIDHLPASLSHLSLGDFFEQRLNNLPASLTHLTLGNSYTSVLPPLPDNLRFLQVGFSYNQPLTCPPLPNTVTHLVLGNEFYQSVDNLPSCLTHLTFGDKFNGKVKHLPPTLTHLIFGDKFNQKIDHLPATLTHLTLGIRFTHRVDHLPPSLHTLDFLFSNFDFPVNNLPDSLRVIHFGVRFNQPVDKLPSFLTELSFKDEFNQPVDQLPCTLTRLALGFNFNQSIDSLPQSLLHLTLGYNFNTRIDTLPSHLKYISFGKNFSFSLPHPIPPSLVDVIYAKNLVPAPPALKKEEKTIEEVMTVDKGAGVNPEVYDFLVN